MKDNNLTPSGEINRKIIPFPTEEEGIAFFTTLTCKEEETLLWLLDYLNTNTAHVKKHIDDTLFESYEGILQVVSDWLRELIKRHHLNCTTEAVLPIKDNLPIPVMQAALWMAHFIQDSYLFTDNPTAPVPIPCGDQITYVEAADFFELWFLDLLSPQREL